ncbi:MAG TPA: hypothetical protein VFC78_15700 [Tepidisphaeraceae bacterium]|nr:hypothetical protein [Tepidisphaeraceae bacterium]
MGNTYQPELWRDLYVMLGTSSAALIGLLFVVMSINQGEIKKNPVFYIRARNITLHLLTTLVEAALILTPQPMFILGVELVALNLLGLRLPAVFVYRYFYKNRKAGARGKYSVFRGMINIGAYLAGIAGGACLIGMSNWGLYLVTVSFVTFLVSGILNAWTIMFGNGETTTTKTK